MRYIHYVQSMENLVQTAERMVIWITAVCIKTFSSIASESNYKVLMHSYLVHARISKYLPSYPPNCFHSCADRGTHLHTRWNCPIVQYFHTKPEAIILDNVTKYEHMWQP